MKRTIGRASCGSEMIFDGIAPSMSVVRLWNGVKVWHIQCGRHALAMICISVVIIVECVQDTIFFPVGLMTLGGDIIVLLLRWLMWLLWLLMLLSMLLLLLLLLLLLP